MNWTTTIISAVAGGLVLFALVWALRRSERPGVLMLKMAGTGLLLWGAYALFSKVFLANQGAGILGGIGPAMTIAVGGAALGLVLMMIWGRDFIGLLVRPLTNAMTGEGQEMEPEPAYEIAIANRKKGRYSEAVAEIQKQLAMFPGDLRGVLMLAEIQAMDLKDLPAAERTLNELIDAPEAEPARVVAALNQIADWRLSLAEDLDGARAALARIRERYPNSEAAFMAGQRLAHLTHPEMVTSRHAPRPVPYVEHPRPAKVGEVIVARPRETPPDEETSQLVEHLRQYPNDMEARERLATLYAEHYHRIEMARGELEHLIAMKGAPPRKRAAWLNRLADFEIAIAGNEAAARAALQRIIDTNPKSAAAEQARVRMNVLGRELKAHGKQSSRSSP